MSARHILVVEDERLIAAGIKHELEDFGYEVCGVASSADDAVEQAVREKPDLVLMDIHLGGGRDGVEAAREIRARCGAPVVFLSAFADPETVARASETESYGYLLKPYEERELQTTIEMAIAKHQTEQRLAETERWLAAILGGVDDAVIATDHENRVHFINLAGEALTGWSKETAVGRPLAEVCVLHDETGPIPLHELADLTVTESHGTDLQARTRLVDRTGREKPVEGSLSPIFDPRGEFLGMALTLRDITRRLELDRARRRHDWQRLQAMKQEAVGRLVGGLAHRLNDLLTVILGNTSLARYHAPTDAEISGALRRVDATGRRAEELVRRLLVFSGRAHGRLRQVRIDRLLHKCVADVKALLDPGISITLRTDDDVWPVVADGLQLAQALTGVCLAAQDVMPTGGRLTLECKNVARDDGDPVGHPRARRGEFVRVRVTDTGSETTRRLLANLFRSPFTPEAGSTGGLIQGLEFLFAVVEHHHGWVESADGAGGGTSLDLYLPRAGSAESASVAERPAKPRGARPTLLLAEAEPMVRDFGRMTLEGHGYKVLVAEDGVQAVELFRDSPERIDVAVIDLNLPRLTGDTVLARLLELDPDVEVIFSSSYFAEDRCDGASHLAAVVSKPYTREGLMRSVEQALARRAEADRLGNEGVRDGSQTGNSDVNSGRSAAEDPKRSADSAGG